MRSRKTGFRSVKLSLNDLLGKDCIEAACAARAYLSGEDKKQLRALAREKVDFYPKAFQQRLAELLPRVGAVCRPAFRTSARGATSAEFLAHSKPALAPVSALGYFRLGEDGRLFLTTKSEHYHVSLGHGFPGYRLIEHARRLGIPNATHNNTRGHITRLLEEELVRTAAGIERGDRAALDRRLASKGASALNRVINLNTGSLAAEAALKMVLSRFYRPQSDSLDPKCQGRIPVVIVIGDDDGALDGNYHGTTVLAQAIRGMWPGLLAAFEKQDIMFVRCVRPNNLEDLDAVFNKYDKGRYKIAGCFHELILMNYAAKRLTKPFVRRMYALCRKHDVPTVVDEIQTGIWSPELYLFREYGVKPTIVVLGKGFPGGECAASRILFSPAMDTLPQFGALVTNGQEELASLAYLITMRWAEANADVARAVGEYYEERLNDLVAKHAQLLDTIEGLRHLAGLYFHDREKAKDFAAKLNEMGLDISVQAYKVSCPPCALTKLPITAGFEVVDAVMVTMRDALRRL